MMAMASGHAQRTVQAPFNATIAMIASPMPSRRTASCAPSGEVPLNTSRAAKPDATTAQIKRMKRSRSSKCRRVDRLLPSIGMPFIGVL